MIVYDKLHNAFESDLFNEVIVSSGFTTRETGDGRSVEIIQSYLRINQILFKELVIPQQIHSANIAVYAETHQDIVYIPDTDGVVTKEKGVALIIRSADCLPILYTDTDAGVIAASHNGWRGTLKNIGLNIIQAMIKIGANIDNIKVSVGPGIGACCYDISEELYYEFMGVNEDEMGAFQRHAGKRFLNLLKMNYALLLKYGIQPQHIDFFPFCTQCDRERFFSYRRDHKKHPDQFGEMFSYIVRN